MGRHFVAITPEVFGARAAELGGLGFKNDSGKERYLAEASKDLWDKLHAMGVSAEPLTVLDPAYVDKDKLEQLYAVQRWFREDLRSTSTSRRISEYSTSVRRSGERSWNSFLRLIPGVETLTFALISGHCSKRTLEGALPVFSFAIGRGTLSHRQIS
jgi:hypothetical protein